MRQCCKRSASGDRILTSKMSIVTDIQAIFDRQNDNGGLFWSRADGNIYSPYGSSTLDTLLVLGELGLSVNDNQIIANAIEYVFAYQTSEGSFKYSLISPKLPCLTARIIAVLCRLGMASDARIEKGYRWLSGIQWNDGGWRCATVKLGKSPLTDASNPGTTLYVLDAFRFRENNSNEIRHLNKGVDFLLQHWDVRQPIGPCQFGIGSKFLQIEYPFFRYNIFYYVYVLSFYEKAKKDKRFLEAYFFLADKIKNGRLVPENPHRAWREFDFAKKRQVSDIATNRWIEIEINMTNKK
jgi:hypothetical protein